MSQTVKIFMGIFFMLMLLFLGIGIISSQIDVANAQDYKADVVVQLENSNYSPAVINACIRQAEKSGYALTIKVYAKEIEPVTYTKPVVTETDGVQMAEVTLTYPYSIGFLNSSTGHSVRGFAR